MGERRGFLVCRNPVSHTWVIQRAVTDQSKWRGWRCLQHPGGWGLHHAGSGCDSSGSLVAAVPRSSGWNGETQQRSWVTEARFQNIHIHIRAPWVLCPGWIHRGNAGETSSPSSSQWEHLPWLCLAKFLCRAEVWDGNIRERVEWMGIRSGKWGDFVVLQQSFLIFLSV